MEANDAPPDAIDIIVPAQSAAEAPKDTCDPPRAHVGASVYLRRPARRLSNRREVHTSMDRWCYLPLLRVAPKRGGRISVQSGIRDCCRASTTTRVVRRQIASRRCTAAKASEFAQARPPMCFQRISWLISAIGSASAASAAVSLPGEGTVRGPAPMRQRKLASWPASGRLYSAKRPGQPAQLQSRFLSAMQASGQPLARVVKCTLPGRMHEQHDNHVF